MMTKICWHLLALHMKSGDYKVRENRCLEIYGKMVDY